MMLAWMTYVFIVTALLTAAAFAAERAARIRSARCRGIWAATIVASLLIPAAIASVSIELPRLSATSSQEGSPVPLRTATSEYLSPAVWIDAAAPQWHRSPDLDARLQQAWTIMSLLVFAGLCLTAAHLSLRKRRWERAAVAGREVLVADEVGPAVVGLLRPCIVVPRWLLERPQRFQSLVLAHEQAHLEARDQQVLAVALCLVVLMPWNLPLWWQLRRLRYAIEVDCDARVLKSGHALADYGEALIEVGRHRSGFVGAVAGMSESASFLERRIAIMTSHARRWWRVTCVAFAAVAVSFVALAAQVSPPNTDAAAEPQSNAAPQERRAISVDPALLERYVGHYRLAENFLIEIRRDGSELFAQLTGQPELEIHPESETKFFWKVVDAQVTFIVDGERASSLVLHQHGQDMPAPRVDAATAAHIDAEREARVRSQVATPGSDAALTRLIEAIRNGAPNYQEMSPELAKAVRQQMPGLGPALTRLGPVQSVRFQGVGNLGWDGYLVHHENGTSQWRISLSSDGKIAGALLTSAP